MYPFKMTISAAAVLLCTGLAACAVHPTITTDRDPSADLALYRTYSFFEPLTTDRKGYSTILSTRLRDATRRELERRGYQYVPSRPELLVNFNVNIRERQELQAMPRFGYFAYRTGLYDPWPGYPYDFYTVTYQEGTLIVDLVDAARRQLVWQGIATGRITNAVMKDPDKVVDKAVTEIFAQYPTTARREP